MTRAGGSASEKVVNPRRSVNMTVLSSETPPSRRSRSVRESTCSTTVSGTNLENTSRTRSRSNAASR